MGNRSAFILADKQTHYKASKHAQSAAKEVKFCRIRVISFRLALSSLSVVIWKIRSGFLVKTEGYVRRCTLRKSAATDLPTRSVQGPGVAGYRIGVRLGFGMTEDQAYIAVLIAQP